MQPTRFIWIHLGDTILISSIANSLSVKINIAFSLRIKNTSQDIQQNYE